METEQNMDDVGAAAEVDESDAAGAVEAPWAFELGQKVSVDFEPGEVTWRRENQTGQRDYLVRSAAGEAWHPQDHLKAV